MQRWRVHGGPASIDTPRLWSNHAVTIISQVAGYLIVIVSTPALRRQDDDGFSRSLNQCLNVDIPLARSQDGDIILGVSKLASQAKTEQS
ncbi:hypothetical protein PPS11_22724 [Pseudomonas putida S11]|nr:hypothetical protein PPS11_22724 [Pseudomonas putida S11]